MAGARTGTAAWRRLRLSILDRDGWRCRCCGKYGDEVDHIVAVHLGGSDDPANLQTLCRGCHIDKTRSERAKPLTPRQAAERRAWRDLLARMVVRAP